MLALLKVKTFYFDYYWFITRADQYKDITTSINYFLTDEMLGNLLY